MIVHTDHAEKNQRSCVYGMGSNMYGQLGRDPIASKSDIFEHLIQINPEIVSKVPYEVIQCETGWFHTLFLIKKDARSESEII